MSTLWTNRMQRYLGVSVLNGKLETDVIRIIASIIDAGTLQCNTVLIGSLTGSSQSASQLDGQNSARQTETLIGAEPHVGHSQ